MELLTERQIKHWQHRVQKSIRDYFYLMDKWAEQQEAYCLLCQDDCNTCSFYKLQEQYCEIFGVEF